MLKAALAGGLALLLLLAATLSVCHTLHRALHPVSPADDHLCLVCSLAHGQLDTAEAAVVPATPCLRIAWGARPASVAFLPSVDFRFSPSRAPPFC